MDNTDLIMWLGAFGPTTRRAGQLMCPTEAASKRLIAAATALENEAIKRWQASRHELQPSL